MNFFEYAGIVMNNKLDYDNCNNLSIASSSLFSYLNTRTLKDEVSDFYSFLNICVIITNNN